MSDSPVLTETRDGVTWITLNRPERMNALDERLRLALVDALRAAVADPQCRVVVLTGTGRGFCVGQDLSVVSELEDAHDTVARTYNPIIETITNAPKPFIAAVNGAAVGAGMGIAVACDIVHMAEQAFYSCAFGAVGLVPDSGASFFLARRLGHHRAFEIAASGRRIAADEALSLGLATAVCAGEELAERVLEQAVRLLSESPKSLALTKQLLWAAQTLPLANTMEAEAIAQGVAAKTDEHVERRTAFLEKGATRRRSGS